MQNRGCPQWTATISGDRCSCKATHIVRLSACAQCEAPAPPAMRAQIKHNAGVACPPWQRTEPLQHCCWSCAVARGLPRRQHRTCPERAAMIQCTVCVACFISNSVTWRIMLVMTIVFGSQMLVAQIHETHLVSKSHHKRHRTKSVCAGRKEMQL